MKGRAILIRAATFAAGAIWALAFLLPTEIGGGLDRHGAFGPSLVGKRLFYTTAERGTGSLTEPDRGAFIAMADLDAIAVRQRAFSRSPLRHDDYYGASHPQVIQKDGGFAMLYVGHGFDGKKRICLATSSDGTEWQPEPRAVIDLDELPRGADVAEFSIYQEGGSTFVLLPALEEGGRVIRALVSEDLKNWRDAGVFYRPPAGEFVERLVALTESEFWITVREGSERRIYSVRVGRSGEERTQIRLPDLPFARTLRQVTPVRADGDWRVLVVGGDPDEQPAPRLRVGLLTGPDPSSLHPAPGSLRDGSVMALGSPATSTYFHELTRSASDFVQVVMTFGVGMGLISLIALHGRRVVRGPSPGYSAIVLVGLVAMIVVQFGYRLSEGEGWKRWSDLLFFHIQQSIGGTMFGLLAAYLLSAAYRAFRVRSFDALVLGVVASLIILAQVPTAQFLTSLIAPNAVDSAAAVDAALQTPRNFLLTVANDAVQRAVGLGVFVGAIAMALRVWLSLDEQATWD